MSYAIRVLNTRRNEIEDRLFEIEEGELDHHPEQQISIHKKELIKRSGELSRAIEMLREKGD